VAEELRTQLAVPVEVINGGHGELTVSVGDREVFREEGRLPDFSAIVNAVRGAEPGGESDQNAYEPITAPGR